ncbi:MAG: hypothetical protein HY650_08295 [Acidobacteria bacterium]|nr:hypothetical protein [Acidobacteriota bacterium]
MPDWTHDQIEKFGYAVANLVADYVRLVETSRVSPGTDPGTLEAEISTSWPETAEDPFALLAEFRDKIVPNSIHISSPNYYGLINPAPTLIGVFAETLAGALNQNCGAWGQSPAASTIERQVIEWLCRLLGYPPTAFGTLTTGGTLANVTAFKLALTWKFPEVAERGITALGSPATFYASEEGHFSLDRAADLVGIGRRHLRKIDSDDHFRIRVDLLCSAIERDLAEGYKPCGLIGIAGTTSTGNVDPLTALGDVARRYHLWYHVDAAYGGPAALSQKWPHLLAGIELADSVTMDPHKWLFVPNLAGAILVKNRQHLRDSFFLQPSYIPQKTADGEETLNFFQLGILGSRRFDALKIWLSLRHQGFEWYRSVIERQIGLCLLLRDLFQSEEGWTVMNRVELGILCVRYTSAALGEEMASSQGAERRMTERKIDQVNNEIQRRMVESGRAWISTTRLKGKTALRINVISHRTREEHVRGLFDLLRECARQAGLNSGNGPSQAADVPPASRT